MGIRAVESFDSSFQLQPEVRFFSFSSLWENRGTVESDLTQILVQNEEVLVQLLQSETFRSQARKLYLPSMFS